MLLHRYEPHVVQPGPQPGPPSPARVRAAVARIVRTKALHLDRFGVVFGWESALTEALQSHVGALAGADEGDITLYAKRLHGLASALAAACEVIELESYDAAEIRAGLASIETECELIATAESVVEDHEAA